VTVRHYSNTATEATLTSGITAVDTTFSLTSFSDYPAADFTAAISRGETDEEIVLVTVVSGSTVTVTRGYDGTTAKSHAAGASFLHVTIAKDYDEANTHVNATSGVHGTSGAVVGTSDAQTLTNKTLTSPTIASATMTGTTSMAALSVTGNATVGGTIGLSGLLTASGGLVVPSGHSTTLDALTASSGAFTGNVSVGGTLTVTGTLTGAAMSATTVTGSGLLKGAGVESTADLVLAQIAAPAGVASKGRLWAQTDGGLYFRTGATTAAVRLPVFWGAGTVLPSTGVLNGDEFQHTGLGCTLRYNGTAWRQAGAAPIVADQTGRDAISTTYSALLHGGFMVWQTDPGVMWHWTGTAWNRHAGDSGWLALTPLSPFTTVTTNGHQTQYRIADGYCHFRFRLSRATGWSAGSGGIQVFTFPVGARPSATYVTRFTKDSTDGVTDGMFSVLTDGTAQINIDGQAGNSIYGSGLFPID
jgi:hypothetical protein